MANVATPATLRLVAGGCMLHVGGRGTAGRYQRPVALPPCAVGLRLGGSPVHTGIDLRRRTQPPGDGRFPRTHGDRSAAAGCPASVGQRVRLGVPGHVPQGFAQAVELRRSIPRSIPGLGPVLGAPSVAAWAGAAARFKAQAGLPPPLPIL